jgi:predicted metal-binding transcription factor (methanogenesis marker protein 9)
MKGEKYMESLQIYEASKKELTKIKKDLSQDLVTIDFSKFDEQTKEVVLSALSSSVSQRIAAVNRVLLGVR